MDKKDGIGPGPGVFGFGPMALPLGVFGCEVVELPPEVFGFGPVELPPEVVVAEGARGLHACCCSQGARSGSTGATVSVSEATAASCASFPSP